VTIHTPDREGYYPASGHLTLRIIFEAYTGRLLGAQAVGKFGVDKRIDVLSTALQAGMSVFDLGQLELSYAPQYGSARDPVNLAGCTASNVVTQDLCVLHPDELVGHTSRWQIIDVRSAKDFSNDHIPAADNIPIDMLRQNIATIKKDSPIIVYSRVGYHGYIAYRILKQLGYQVANLDGGWKLWQAGGYQARR
jgi:rhodanese-related sulfurtransferase